jgi:hypothetical protein
MTQAADPSRRFRVHARHLDRNHARVVEERSFEAAAVAYVEDLAPATADGEVSIVVHDLASGHEHCFRIDLDSGETAVCS